MSSLPQSFQSRTIQRALCWCSGWRLLFLASCPQLSLLLKALCRTGPTCLQDCHPPPAPGSWRMSLGFGKVSLLEHAAPGADVWDLGSSKGLGTSHSVLWQPIGKPVAHCLQAVELERPIFVFPVKNHRCAGAIKLTQQAGCSWGTLCWRSCVSHCSTQPFCWGRCTPAWPSCASKLPRPPSTCQRSQKIWQPTTRRPKFFQGVQKHGQTILSCSWNPLFRVYPQAPGRLSFLSFRKRTPFRMRPSEQSRHQVPVSAQTCAFLTSLMGALRRRAGVKFRLALLNVLCTFSWL